MSLGSQLGYPPRAWLIIETTLTLVAWEDQLKEVTSRDQLHQFIQSSSAPALPPRLTRRPQHSTTPTSSLKSMSATKKDPLSLLRDFTISKKPITLISSSGNLATELTDASDVVFADDKQTFTFPRTTPTAYRRGNSDETYTLETLLFLLQRANQSVAEYSLEGAQKGIPIVSILDKRLVLDYLTGVTATSANIVYQSSEQSKLLTVGLTNLSLETLCAQSG